MRSIGYISCRGMEPASNQNYPHKQKGLPVEKNLYEQLTDKIMMTGSKLIPELFRMIADEEEASLLLTMPGTPQALSEKVGRKKEVVDEMCARLYRKGLAFKCEKVCYQNSIGQDICFRMSEK